MQKNNSKFRFIGLLDLLCILAVACKTCPELLKNIAEALVLNSIHLIDFPSVVAFIQVFSFVVLYWLI